ncbi:MAG: hypothetical protein AAFY88_09425 [Acidobacteriota bacterium]
MQLCPRLGPCLYTAALTAATAMSLALAPAATAGHVYTVTVSDHTKGGVTSTQEMLVEGQNLKMTVASGDDAGGHLIFRGDRRQLLFLDPESMTYMHMDKEIAQSLKERFGDVNAQRDVAGQQLREKLSHLDPAQREKLEQFLGTPPGGAGDIFGDSPGSLRLEPSSTRAERAGYPTVRWDAYRGDEKFMELWVTDWSNLEGGAEVRRTFEDLGRFWGELVEAGMPSEDFEMLEALIRVKGFSVHTLMYERQRVSVGWELEGTEPRVLLLDEFEPEGFTRQQMPGGL